MTTLTTTTDQEIAWHSTVEAIFRTESANLCRLAGRLLSPSAAEEVVQESFARFATMEGRPSCGSEAAYLRSMVMNEARSVLRRRQIHDRHLHRWVKATDADGVAEAVIAEDEQQAMRRRVKRLSTRQRQVIELRFLDQLSEREIAERLNISTGSVKTHCFRALEAMRASWTVAAA